MSPVIPRWEWRTFEDRSPVPDAFARLEPTGVQESDELYLLTSDLQNVKIRDDLLDIKVLREVDADGLERWEPVLKVPFPIPVDQATELQAILGTHRPTTQTLSLETFLDEVTAPAGPARAIQVHKRRVRYRIGGCTSEVTDLVVDGHATRTIAIESEDAAAVVAAIRSAGLHGYTNTSYPRGLRAIVERASRRYAVLDVGTNSVKYHVTEVTADGSWHRVADRAELTRLGEGLAASGVISDAALDRTAAAIGDMARESRDLGAVALVAVGTAGLRIAANSDAVLAAIGARTGVSIEVISGDEESRLAYLAVTAGLPPAQGSTVVFDTGGGSSQFTFGSGSDIVERFSVDVGAARYTERFGMDGAISAERLDEALSAIASDLARVRGRGRPDALVGMGGAITNLTAVALGMSTYDPARIQGATLGRDEVDRQIEVYRSVDATARAGIPGLQPKRAEVILAGACIVRTVMDLLDQGQLTVSDHGLRHGVLAERFGMREEGRTG